jgi:hypothetical protein
MGLRAMSPIHDPLYTITHRALLIGSALEKKGRHQTLAIERQDLRLAPREKNASKADQR